MAVGWDGSIAVICQLSGYSEMEDAMNQSLADTVEVPGVFPVSNDIERERRSIKMWAARIDDPVYVNVLDNLELHIKRLRTLETEWKRGEP